MKKIEMPDYKEKLNCAAKGRKYWQKIKEKFLVTSEDLIIVFPVDNEQLNSAMTQNIDYFIKKKYLRRAIILVKENLKLDFLDLNKMIEIEKVSTENVDDFIDYFRLTAFFENIIIVSDREPFGNLNLVYQSDISLDDYIKNTYL